MQTVEISKNAYSEYSEYLPTNWINSLFTITHTSTNTTYGINRPVVVSSDFKQRMITDLTNTYRYPRRYIVRYSYLIILMLFAAVSYYNIIMSPIVVLTGCMYFCLIEYNICTSKQYLLEQHKYARLLVDDILSTVIVSDYIDLCNEYDNAIKQGTANLNIVSNAYTSLLEDVLNANMDIANQHIRKFNPDLSDLMTYTQFTETIH